MSSLEGLGLEFEESMSGWLGVGETEPLEGLAFGERQGTALRFDVRIAIHDLAGFLNISSHTANLTGTVTFEPLGGTFPIRDGSFNLFSVDRWSGLRQMTYSFRFTAADGNTYYLHGFKNISDDPGLDVIEDMTTLFTTIYRGEEKHAPVYGAGQIFFKLRDAPAMMASLTVTGDASAGRKIMAKLAFISFAFGRVRDEYLRHLNPFYNTEYQNLVLAGTAKRTDGRQTGFFLVSGAHEKDFPWGDGETFWDLLLVVGDEDSGYSRYCITDRVLEGMHIDIDRGTYRYDGPIFQLTEGYTTSFSAIRVAGRGLVQCRAEIEIGFDAQPYETSPFPFEIGFDVMDRLSFQLSRTLRMIVPSERLLGIHIIPHTVTINEGSIKLTQETLSTDLEMVREKTFGEAENSTFLNIKEPTMLYGYICSLRPEDKIARVQIQANSLRNDREYWSKDKIDAILGAVVSRLTSKELLMKEGHLKVGSLCGTSDCATGVPRFIKVGPPIIEVNNDHFPTAVFQRRIVKVRDSDGVTCLALEEDMDLMRLEAENSPREVIVAAIRDEDKFVGLEKVLEATGFWELLENKRKTSGKSKDDFSIVIKPNFMFAYNKADRSTFADPELVAHLVKLIRNRAGFSDVSVVEAQSTYGQYFDNRSVRFVADYLGYDSSGNSGYKLVDLTKDEWIDHQFGEHLGIHPAPRTWRDASFRISLAKNKTHAYSFYTLTLKNIYGALPLANKFKEYHCERDIYHTTIEYLRAFPVDYGLIDAYLSADGPFGIFADSDPNPTHTIIGGADLVAVDWVGATKMGLHPKISQYMDLAIKAFGKPRIKLVGDPNPYKPWLNVPMVLTLFTHFGLDSNHYFGNLLYMTGAYMDDETFHHKSRDRFIQTARELINPLQKVVFLQPGGERTAANVAFSRFMNWLGE